MQMLVFIHLNIFVTKQEVQQAYDQLLIEKNLMQKKLEKVEEELALEKEKVCQLESKLLEVEATAEMQIDGFTEIGEIIKRFTTP